MNFEPAVEEVPNQVKLDISLFVYVQAYKIVTHVGLLIHICAILEHQIVDFLLCRRHSKRLGREQKTSETKLVCVVYIEPVQGEQMLHNQRIDWLRSLHVFTKDVAALPVVVSSNFLGFKKFSEVLLLCGHYALQHQLSVDHAPASGQICLH